MNGKCVFSIDVEDWFHILDLPSTPAVDRWSALPSRVEKDFLELLDLFAAHRVRTTCFFLGWVAEKFPHLVREAVRRGHEIGSHGYAHRLVYAMSAREFRCDAEKAKRIIESAAGERVDGFRAPGFSAVPATPWFFDELGEAGYRYDSSVFPAHRNHGGWAGAERGPHLAGRPGRRIVEIPVTVRTVLGRDLSFFGGGYLRLFPFTAIREMTAATLREGLPVVFYVHPREIDPGHPRLPMAWRRRFKTYVNLATTRAKIERLLAQFEFLTFREYVEEFVLTHGMDDAEGTIPERGRCSAAAG